jgi:hypothetical protein
MKYFEFKDDGSGYYYALICAESEEKAKSIYAEEVGELDDDYAGPDEISVDDAKKKYLKAVPAEFDAVENDILLIDGDLA